MYYQKSETRGGEVAGYENIKDHGFDKRTAGERRELAIKAGKASGKVRRKKADFNKTLNALLTAEIDSEEWKPVLEALGLECTLESAMLMAQIKEAMKGNTKAAYFVAQYAGQCGLSEAEGKEQEARTEQIKANTERIKKNAGSSVDTDEGVTIINDAPTGEDIGYRDSEVSEDI